MIRLAIQKSGRLNEQSLDLLKDCGIKFSNSSRILKTTAKNFPIELLYLRDDDIPQYVEQGVADIGIVGENEMWEKDKKIDCVTKLGFAQCRLALAIPKDEVYTDLSYFQGKKIATSYPKILSDFFSKENIAVTVEEITGSVEIAPGIGLSHAIFDIVSTGSTLLMNGLKEVHEVCRSEAVLIGNKQLSEEKKKLVAQLLFRIETVIESRNYKYLMLNSPNSSVEKISKLLGGIKSPTILPLAEEGWMSIHAVIKESEFWDKINDLKKLGAEGILVLPIERLIQ